MPFALAAPSAALRPCYVQLYVLIRSRLKGTELVQLFLGKNNIDDAVNNIKENPEKAKCCNHLGEI